MKTCTKCKLPKDLEEFPDNKGCSDGKGSWCRECFRAYNRSYDHRRGSDSNYKLSKKLYVGERRVTDIESVRVIGRRHFKAQQDWINSLKEGSFCADCHSGFPSCCMDFDHVRGEKLKAVSQMLGYSRDRILLEIAKCELVCSCCHRVRTSNRKVSSGFTTRQQIFYLNLAELKSNPCRDCGGTFPPVAMDFDHVRGVKVTDLARMSQMSWDLVLDEVAKCDLVCANCHRVRTQSRRSMGEAA